MKLDRCRALVVQRIEVWNYQVVKGEWVKETRNHIKKTVSLQIHQVHQPSSYLKLVVFRSQKFQAFLVELT